MRSKKNNDSSRKTMKKTKKPTKSIQPSHLKDHYNADEENWKTEDENSPSSGLGYRNARPPRAVPRMSRKVSEEDPGYAANVEDNLTYDLDVDEHVEHIIESYKGTDRGCSRMTLPERLQAVDAELSKVFESYNKLIHGIAEQTIAEFIRTQSLKKSYSKKLKRWYKTASRRASIYQLTSQKDLHARFCIYFLPLIVVKSFGF